MYSTEVVSRNGLLMRTSSSRCAHPRSTAQFRHTAMEAVLFFPAQLLDQLPDYLTRFQEKRAATHRLRESARAYSASRFNNTQAPMQSMKEGGERDMLMSSSLKYALGLCAAIGLLAGCNSGGTTNSSLPVSPSNTESVDAASAGPQPTSRINQVNAFLQSHDLAQPMAFSGPDGKQCRGQGMKCGRHPHCCAGLVCAAGACEPQQCLNQQCGGFFPPCCRGFGCVPGSDRAFCEPCPSGHCRR